MLDEFKNDARVVHCQKEPYDVYIGRPSEWGNPFTHIKNRDTQAKFIVNTREEAIQKYREWLKTNENLLNKLSSLEGKRLGCWCHPKPCHGDVILEFLRQSKI